MGYGKGMRIAGFLLFICVAILCITPPAFAVELAVVARFAPEEGTIADAAILGDGRLVLLYPALGRIADYSFSGLLNQHITREGGESTRFKPTACANGPANSLVVFDEASNTFFSITQDGNFLKGVTLATPNPGRPKVISRIEDLAVDRQGSYWVLLPDGGKLVKFDNAGSFIGDRNLRKALDDNLALPSRFQLQENGSLTFLDYHQGAVFMESANLQFQRIAPNPDTYFDATPSVQDFAVDNNGNMLVATFDEQHPLVLLIPANGEMVAHPVSLDFPDGAKRLAIRYSAGKFIVWSREEPFLVVIELH